MKKLLGNLSLLAALLTLCAIADAQVYTKFGPANGVLKGSTTTFQTTAAASTDVVSLWSGTCDATHFLAGNGTCAIPAGSGVTSVGLTVPSWYTVTGSPVTGAGTLAINAASGQTANSFLATPNGSTGTVALRAIFGADLPPINLDSTANGGVASASILLGTNGGTSNGFFSVIGPTTSLKTYTFPNASATILTGNAPVTVPQGGTGLATLPTHGVLLGEGTSSVANVAAMAADTLLQGQGASADPVAVPVNNCGSGTQALSYSTSTHTFGCQTITTSLAPITCTTACSGTSLAVGQEVYLVKGSNTSVTSNATTAPDADLRVTGLPAGNFEFQFGLFFSAGANAGGYKFGWTQTTLSCGPAVPNGGPQFFIYNNGTTTAGAPIEVSATVAATSDNSVQGFGSFQTAISGFVQSLCWSQATSNATATTLAANTSFLRIKRIK